MDAVVSRELGERPRGGGSQQSGLLGVVELWPPTRGLEPLAQPVTGPAQPQRPLDGDPLEAEPLVAEDLHAVTLSERSVELDELADLLVRELLALLPQALAHLHPRGAGIDELHLAASLRTLAVRDDPEVGRAAGVVEELVGKRDDGLEPVVLDDPAADLRLARARRAGEERRAVEHNRDPRASLLGRPHLREHVLEKKEAAVVDPRQPRSEAAAEAACLVLIADDLLDLLPLHAERRVREHVVERAPRVAVVRERV